MPLPRSCQSSTGRRRFEVAYHDQQTRMRVFHGAANLLGDWNQQHCGNCVRDTIPQALSIPDSSTDMTFYSQCSDDQCDAGKENEHGVEALSLDSVFQDSVQIFQ